MSNGFVTTTSTGIPSAASERTTPSALTYPPITIAPAITAEHD